MNPAERPEISMTSADGCASGCHRPAVLQDLRTPVQGASVLDNVGRRGSAADGFPLSPDLRPVAPAWPALRRCCLLRHDAHVIVGNLKETAFDVESVSYAMTEA